MIDQRRQIVQMHVIFTYQISFYSLICFICASFFLRCCSLLTLQFYCLMLLLLLCIQLLYVRVVCSWQCAKYKTLTPMQLQSIPNLNINKRQQCLCSKFQMCTFICRLMHIVHCVYACVTLSRSLCVCPIHSYTFIIFFIINAII